MPNQAVVPRTASFALNLPIIRQTPLPTLLKSAAEKIIEAEAGLAKKGGAEFFGIVTSGKTIKAQKGME